MQQHWSHDTCRPESSIALLSTPISEVATEDAPNDNICPSIVSDAASIFPSSVLDTSQHGDLHVFVTARPNPSEVPGASTVCHRSAFGRPIVAHINVHAPLVMHLFARRGREVGAGEFAAAAVLHATLRHEMMHVLAFMWNSLRQFRDASRMLQVCRAGLRTRHQPRQCTVVLARSRVLTASRPPCVRSFSDQMCQHVDVAPMFCFVPARPF